MSTRQDKKGNPPSNKVNYKNICKDKDLLRRRRQESMQSRALLDAKRELRKWENDRHYTWDKYVAEREACLGSFEERSRLRQPDIPKNIDDLAKYLRVNATESELKFYPLLKTLAAKHNDSVYFQHIVGRRFIVDFYLPKCKLAIELDGQSHHGKEERDAKRDTWIYNNAGITTLRFSSYVSMINPNSIIRDIDERIAKMARYKQV